FTRSHSCKFVFYDSSFSASLHTLPSHSFPTRRSSDLYNAKRYHCITLSQHSDRDGKCSGRQGGVQDEKVEKSSIPVADGGNGPRSEEHTSELQSRFDIVCRLLLEKKKDSIVVL